MVGCASHRLNLAVKNVQTDDDALLKKMNRMMIKLRGLLLSARLRRFTQLRPKIRNPTRWSSTYDMMKRYKQLSPFFSDIDSSEIVELALSPSELRTLDALLNKLKVFESVSKVLQKDRTSIGDVRAVFDAIIDEFPSTSNRLGSYSAIVHCPHFESALVKIQRGNESTLSREEQNLLFRCSLGTEYNEQENIEGLSFVERALK